MLCPPTLFPAISPPFTLICAPNLPCPLSSLSSLTSDWTQALSSWGRRILTNWIAPFLQVSSTVNFLSRLSHLSRQANLHWFFKIWIKCHLLINIKLVALISWWEGSYGDFSLSMNHILFELSWNAILLSSLNFKKRWFFSPFLWKLPCLSSPDGINYALWWSFKASVHVWLS